jgi:Family of unknown function (DUF6580)
VKNSHLHAIRDALVLVLLVGIGVAGRWAQPEWCFTPTAAVAVFAGFYFSRTALAAMVPLAVLMISDLALPAYDSLTVMIATYAVMTLPVFFGRLLRGQHSGWSTAWRWAVCGLAPAVLFYFVTNFAVWAFQSDYPKTLSGLATCYWAAVPFFRWMAAGDVVYLAAIFGCWALAGMELPHADRAQQPVTLDNR